MTTEIEELCTRLRNPVVVTRINILAADVIERLTSENEALREGFQLALTGGNHLANVLIGKLGAGFAEKYPPDLDHEIALHSLCATDTYDVWCCWSALMNARAALSKKGKGE